MVFHPSADTSDLCLARQQEQEKQIIESAESNLKNVAVQIVSYSLELHSIWEFQLTVKTYCSVPWSISCFLTSNLKQQMFVSQTLGIKPNAAGFSNSQQSDLFCLCWNDKLQQMPCNHIIQLDSPESTMENSIMTYKNNWGQSVPGSSLQKDVSSATFSSKVTAALVSIYYA